MNDHQIPLSQAPVTKQIVISGIIVLTACVVTTIFFNRLVMFAPEMQSTLLTVLWIVLPVLWLGSSLLLLAKWPTTTYTVGENALVVHKKGLFGASSEQFYGYDTITGIENTKNAFGNYGSVTIAMGSERIVIGGVIHPSEQAHAIRQIAADHHTRVQLVSK